MSAIFGGSKQKSQQQSMSQQESGNKAYQYVQQQADPNVQLGNQANSFMANLLGMGDSEAGDAAFGAYKNSTGYQSALDEGLRAVGTNAAQAGALNSGATEKARMKYASNLNNGFFDKFMSNLLNVSGIGSSSLGQLIGAGQYSTGSSQSSGSSSGNSSNGVGGFLGSLMGAAAASDPRLKENVEFLGKQNGLNVYSWNYIWDDEDIRHTGYMADEIAESHPHALGPKLAGEYLTLDYSKLPAIEGV